MSEIIIILKSIFCLILIGIALTIIIPLFIYLSKKRHESNAYRHIKTSVLFILTMWWAHSWSDASEYLFVYWMFAIAGFAVLNLIIWANPVTKKRRIK